MDMAWCPLSGATLEKLACPDQSRLIVSEGQAQTSEALTSHLDAALVTIGFDTKRHV